MLQRLRWNILFLFGRSVPSTILFVTSGRDKRLLGYSVCCLIVRAVVRSINVTVPSLRLVLPFLVRSSSCRRTFMLSLVRLRRELVVSFRCDLNFNIVCAYSLCVDLFCLSLLIFKFLHLSFADFLGHPLSALLLESLDAFLESLVGGRP
jgi:hypothetical protein